MMNRDAPEEPEEPRELPLNYIMFLDNLHCCNLPHIINREFRPRVSTEGLNRESSSTADSTSFTVTDESPADGEFLKLYITGDHKLRIFLDKDFFIVNFFESRRQKMQIFGCQ